MGQQNSKPLNPKSSLQLNHLYSPHTHKHRLPGQPLLLRLNQPPKQKQKTDFHSQLQQTIQSYSFQLCLSQQESIEYKKIFAQRKNCLPWHIKVLFSQMIKDQCHCANNKYKMTVYTEHVETRLCNFRVTDPTRITKYGQAEIMDSFSLSQSIYVLINILHGFQLLMDQFRVNYPSSQSIGINRKGQVKVWLCDNWALNSQNNRNIHENLLIQQIISLVQERTKDTLCELLNLKHTYMSWTFDSLQEKLAQQTIHFNQGKKSLEKRIGKMLTDKQKKERASRKFPMNKVYTEQSSKFSLPLPNQQFTTSNTERDSAKLPTTERRTYSNETNERMKTSKIVQINYINNNVKKGEIPRNNSNQSTKRPLVFTYQHYPTSVQPSPKMSVPTYSSSQVRQSTKYQYVQQQIQNRPKVNSLPLIQKQPKKAQYLSYPRISQEPITPKIIQQIQRNSFSNNSSRIKNINLGMQAFVLDNVERVQSGQMFRKMKEQKNRSPMTIQFQIPSPEKSDNVRSASTPQSQSSLTQITSQFKNLLQSDKRIKELDEDSFEADEPEITSYDKVALSFENSEESEKVIRQTRTFNQKSEQLLPSYWQINFQSIKQVDEDVSYSIDDKE